MRSRARRPVDDAPARLAHDGFDSRAAGGGSADQFSHSVVSGSDSGWLARAGWVSGRSNAGERSFAVGGDVLRRAGRRGGGGVHGPSGDAAQSESAAGGDSGDDGAVLREPASDGEEQYPADE